jgi:hypothetical protein
LLRLQDSRQLQAVSIVVLDNAWHATDRQLALLSIAGMWLLCLAGLNVLARLSMWPFTACCLAQPMALHQKHASIQPA